MELVKREKKQEVGENVMTESFIICIVFWRPRCRWEDTSKTDFKYSVKMWTEFMSLRTGSSSGIV
jgi:hypothetical protein